MAAKRFWNWVMLSRFSVSHWDWPWCGVAVMTMSICRWSFVTVLTICRSMAWPVRQSTSWREAKRVCSSSSECTTIESPPARRIGTFRQRAECWSYFSSSYLFGHNRTPITSIFPLPIQRTSRADSHHRSVDALWGGRLTAPGHPTADRIDVAGPAAAQLQLHSAGLDFASLRRGHPARGDQQDECAELGRVAESDAADVPSVVGVHAVPLFDAVRGYVAA